MAILEQEDMIGRRMIRAARQNSVLAGAVCRKNEIRSAEWFTPVINKQSCTRDHIPEMDFSFLRDRIMTTSPDGKFANAMMADIIPFVKRVS